MSKIEQLKERIEYLEYELDIMTDFAGFYFDANGLESYFKFKHDEWKHDLAICKKLGCLWEAYVDIFKLNDEEKTDYYLSILNKQHTIEYSDLFKYDGTLWANHNPFIIYLINHDIYPDTNEFEKKSGFKDLHVLINSILEDKSEFCKHVQNIFNSIMFDSKILYWDANIFSIIQLYLNLPYHWKKFKYQD